MSNRLFSQREGFALVCPVIRAAPSRKRRRERRLLLTAVVLMLVLPLAVCLTWHVGMRLVEARAS
ncbi:MAG TPA: hypothetical protein PK490_19740, partial [Prosthecobacter sp.]|nr:hypothetical protein [Prosthecobacter sp.]